jgi:hypothetical protein
MLEREVRGGGGVVVVVSEGKGLMGREKREGSEGPQGLKRNVGGCKWFNCSAFDSIAETRVSDQTAAQSVRTISFPSFRLRRSLQPWSEIYC